MSDPDEPRQRVDRVPDDADLSDVEHRFPSMAAKTEALPEDEWDGMCDRDFEMAPRTDDNDAAALVLFADVDFTDPDAVAQRQHEWAELAESEG